MQFKVGGQKKKKQKKTNACPLEKKQLRSAQKTRLLQLKVTNTMLNKPCRTQLIKQATKT